MRMQVPNTPPTARLSCSSSDPRCACKCPIRRRLRGSLAAPLISMRSREGPCATRVVLGTFMRPVSRSREWTKVLLVAARLHVRDDGFDGSVTEGLEGQDAKGLLDLDPELLDPEEEDGEGS